MLRACGLAPERGSPPAPSLAAARAPAAPSAPLRAQPTRAPRRYARSGTPPGTAARSSPGLYSLRTHPPSIPRAGVKAGGKAPSPVGSTALRRVLTGRYGPLRQPALSSPDGLRNGRLATRALSPGARSRDSPVLGDAYRVACAPRTTFALRRPALPRSGGARGQQTRSASPPSTADRARSFRLAR